MHLNIRQIENVPGGVLPFSFSLDLSDIAFFGARPIPEPVEVTGEVKNRAGALVLSAEAVSTIHLACDRCMRQFTRTLRVPFQTMLASELQEEEQDDILLIQDGQVDVGDLMQTAFILGMDSKHLCAEDCKGLCSGCGADLNTEPCRCKREVDPRLAKLADFFTKDS